jgi:hypothetical protein
VSALPGVTASLQHSISSNTKSQRHESLQRAHRGWTWKSRGRSSRLVPFKQMPNGLASRRLVGGEKTKRQGATSAGTCARSSNPNLHQESKPNVRPHMRAAHCARRMALHQVPHGHESGSSLLSAANISRMACAYSHRAHRVKASRNHALLLMPDPEKCHTQPVLHVSDPAPKKSLPDGEAFEEELRNRETQRRGTVPNSFGAQKLAWFVGPWARGG